MQARPLAPKKFYNREANGIWTPRRSRREDAMGSVITRGRAQQFETLRAVKNPDDEEMREALDIGESSLEFRRYFERPFSLVLRTQTLRNLLSGLVRASYVTDEP